MVQCRVMLVRRRPTERHSAHKTDALTWDYTSGGTRTRNPQIRSLMHRQVSYPSASNECGIGNVSPFFVIQRIHVCRRVVPSTSPPGIIRAVRMFHVERRRHPFQVRHIVISRIAILVVHII